MKDDRAEIVQLAIGRILRMMSRPYQDGDIDTYHRCRALILDALESDARGGDWKPDFARDYFRGSRS